MTFGQYIAYTVTLTTGEKHGVLGEHLEDWKMIKELRNKTLSEG